MARHANRVDKLERGVVRLPHLLHVFPGQSDAQALAAYQRKNGRIPKDAAVVVIRHSFKSRI